MERKRTGTTTPPHPRLEDHVAPVLPFLTRRGANGAACGAHSILLRIYTEIKSWWFIYRLEYKTAIKTNELDLHFPRM